MDATPDAAREFTRWYHPSRRAYSTALGDRLARKVQEAVGSDTYMADYAFTTSGGYRGRYRFLAKMWPTMDGKPYWLASTVTLSVLMTKGFTIEYKLEDGIYAHLKEKT